MKYLIINSDDFGLTSGVNRATIDCYRSGLLTSTTIVVNAAAFQEAVEASKENPGLRLGVHINLTSGPSDFLLKELRESAIRGKGYNSFFRGFLTGAIKKHHLEQEIALQIEKALAAGLEPTHVDSHHHIHAFPPIMDIFLKAAGRYGIRRIRLPLEFYGLTQYGPHSPSKHFKNPFRMQNVRITMMSLFSRLCIPRIKAAGFAAPRRLFGTPLYNFPDLPTLRWILDEAEEGIQELMVHVGYADETLRKVSTLADSRELQLKLLQSKEAAAAVKERSIEVANYTALPLGL